MGMLASLLSSVFRVNYAMYAQPVLHDCVIYLPIVRGDQASLTKEKLRRLSKFDSRRIQSKG